MCILTTEAQASLTRNHAAIRPGSVPCSPSSAARRQLRLADGSSPAHASDTTGVRSVRHNDSLPLSEHAAGLHSCAAAASDSAAVDRRGGDASRAALPATTAGATTLSSHEDSWKPLAGIAPSIHILATAGAPAGEVWRLPPSPVAAGHGGQPSGCHADSQQPPLTDTPLRQPVAPVADQPQDVAGTPFLYTAAPPSPQHLRASVASAPRAEIETAPGYDDQPQSQAELLLVRSVSLREAYGGSPAGQPAEQPSEAHSQLRGSHDAAASRGDDPLGRALPPYFAERREHGAAGGGSHGDAARHVAADDVEDEADLAFSLVRAARAASAPRLSAIDEADEMGGAIAVCRSP